MTDKTTVDQLVSDAMEEFYRDNPIPADADSDEFYEWDRRRIHCARAVIAKDMARVVQAWADKQQHIAKDLARVVQAWADKQQRE